MKSRDLVQVVHPGLCRNCTRLARARPLRLRLGDFFKVITLTILDRSYRGVERQRYWILPEFRYRSIKVNRANPCAKHCRSVVTSSLTVYNRTSPPGTILKLVGN